jgi:AraC family transcriptional activator of tynA and feaB
MATVAAPPTNQLTSEPERWNVTAGSVPRRLDAWAMILAASHVAFDVHATDRTPENFRGLVSRRSFGELKLVDCAASPFRGRRGSSLLDQGPGAGQDDVLGLQFVWRGVETVREGHRELALSTGDVVLWDGRQPTDIEVVEPLYKRTLMFPRELVFSACPRLAEQVALPSLDRSGPTRLLVRYMNALALELPRLDAAGGAAAASAAIELLRAAVEPSLPASRSTTRAALRAQIREYVRRHLQDPALGPAEIAHAHALSLRALHALFEDAEESVAGLVRRERLARCREDLQQPAGGTVTSVAFRWGFCDAAHFSRVFKRAYGVTPRAVRQAALEGH